MGTIYKKGESYSHAGFGFSATDVVFKPGLSGMSSGNVNDAILELADIVTNAVAQFATHQYEFTGANGQTKMEFLKESLVTSSRTIGGFHLFYLTVSATDHYVGLTTTAGTKCSFTIHSVENPSMMYYGSFDNMNTGSSNSFSMYQINGDGTELFTKSGFTI